MKLHLNSFFHAVRYALDSAKYDSVFLKVKQLKILEACMLRKHVIGVLPTGYGKSVIFHLLPYMSDYINEKVDRSIVIVISPLNALIADQVSSLKARGVSAGVLQAYSQQETNQEDDTGSSDSDEDGNERRTRKNSNEYVINERDMLHRLQTGKYKIVYTHPEAFISCRDGRKVFQSDLYQDRVKFCVVDEAHLVEEWGSEFRPDFGKLAQLGSLFPSAPILALTATAPQKLVQFLKENLQIKNSDVIVGNLDRCNIFICKEKRRSSTYGAESFDDILIPIAEELKVKLTNYPLTVIYLPLKWCGYAFKLFLSVLEEKRYYPNKEKRPGNCLFAQYHAPQTSMMKDEILKQLTGAEKCNIRVVFATVAIGLGVNIHQVRHVIHLDVPRTLETYYQEIGRAGRDNKPAKATLYYNGNELASNKSGMTDEMRNYCRLADTCLREALLSYLGSRSDLGPNSPQPCCSNCLKDQMNSLHTSLEQHPVAPFLELRQVRTVSQQQRNEITRTLQKYRVHLGSSRRRFGSIDSTTGFTLKLIDSVVANCEFVTRGCNHGSYHICVW